MVGLVLLLSYPVFLVLAIFFVARRDIATTPAGGIARWLLAIPLAFGGSFGLALIAFSFNRHIYSYNDNYETFDYVVILYSGAFWRESIVIALLLLIVGLMLLVLDRLRQPSTKESVSENTGDTSLVQTAWAFTSIFAVTILLAMFLLIIPYFDAQANAARVYAATHNRGLDPRDWFPFSWEWPGIFLYEVAFWVWSFTAFFVLPIVAAQAHTLKRIWRKLKAFERTVHVGSATTATLFSIFMLTVGGFILYWLRD